MRMVKLCLVLFLGLVLSAAMGWLEPAQGQGTAAAASLLITPGARADAMGRAHSAVVNDATANWWNPAALGMMEDRIFSLMHTQLVPDLADDVYYEYLGYAQHLKGWGGIGFNIIFLSYGTSPEVDDFGNPGDDFYSFEVSPGVSAGIRLVKDLYGGVSLKFVHVDLAPEGAGGIEGEGKGNTFAADLGLLYRPTNTPVSLSAVVQNLGPNIVFLSSDDSQPIGRNLRLGLGLYLMETEDMGVLASFDFNKSLVYSNEKPIYNWGAEWAYRNVLALRAGYIHDKQGEIIDPTFGFGLAYHKFTFEYASVPQAEGLDRVSKFSINYRF